MSGPTWRRYLRFWRGDPAADLDDELRFHIEARVAEYEASGLSAQDARLRAGERFGDLERVRRDCERIDKQYIQERRRADMWDVIKQDVRYALRALRRYPGFAIVAVITLALGIGANTAVFSVVNGVLLRPLPYHQPDRLVRLYTAFRGSGVERYAMSQPEFMDYKGLTNAFESAAAFTGVGMTLTGKGEPQRVRGIAATRDLFPTLAIRPWRGRNFEGQEGREGVEPVVVLSYQFWNDKLGAREDAIGSVLTLNGISRRVIGILPPNATFERAEAFIPIYINPDSMTGRGTNYLRGVARLRSGVTIEQAQRELNAVTKRIAEQYASTYPASMGYGATVVSMRDVLVGDVRPALLILLGAVGLVLLIACANVANLLLARGEARQREMAVRLAMGASAKRLVRQLLTESAVLSLAGALAGVLLAWWGTKALLSLNPDAIPRMELVGIDSTVALVTLGVALLTGMLFGLAPALQMIKPQLQSALKEGTRGGTLSAAHQRLGRGLVIAEIALAMVVVVGAGLLVKSFRTLRHSDPGFDPDNMLVVDLSLPASRFPPPATVAFYRELVSRMAALPGVRVAAAASDMPPNAGGYNWDVEIDGRPLQSRQSAPSPNVRAVIGDYFRAMSVPLVRGRTFGPQDSPRGEPVALINETFARTVWRDRDPIGARVRFSKTMPWVRIVGVARDVRSMGLANPPPLEMYVLHDQLAAFAGSAETNMYVVLKTQGDPTALAASARRIVRQMDPLLAIVGINSMDEAMDRAVAGPRFTMVLLGLFGALALALAAIGIYGLMTYAVRRRTREIGIRMALGARQSDVLRLVVGQGMKLAVSGLVAGVLVALLATRVLQRILFGVSASDPLTFVTIAALLCAVALVASWLPARRATIVDPTTALRSE